MTIGYSYRVWLLFPNSCFFSQCYQSGDEELVVDIACMYAHAVVLLSVECISPYMVMLCTRLLD